MLSVRMAGPRVRSVRVCLQTGHPPGALTMKNLYLAAITDDSVRSSAPASVRPMKILPAVVGDAPIAWVARSVLEAIEQSARHAAPYQVGGELLGYWVTTQLQPIVSDWNGFGSAIFRARRDSPPAGWNSLGERDDQPWSSTTRVTLGSWSTASMADPRQRGLLGPRPPTEERRDRPYLRLVLDAQHAWRPRLWMYPRHRWPWDVLRGPRELEIRMFSPPSLK